MVQEENELTLEKVLRGSAIRVDLQINGQDIREAVIDTGASSSVIGKKICRKLGLKTMGVTKKVVGLGGGIADVTEKVRLSFAGKQIWTQLLVYGEKFPMLLGLGDQKKLGMIIDTKSHKVTLEMEAAGVVSRVSGVNEGQTLEARIMEGLKEVEDLVLISLLTVSSTISLIDCGRIVPDLTILRLSSWFKAFRSLVSRFVYRSGMGLYAVLVVP
eukprot:GHVP01040611.1.p1 GENE.GHVP01040611.1~~GHVP01040611.1.p1  ORF type:complete len:215 (+),score=26.14 GHVP01040611.1:303-947(+)